MPNYHQPLIDESANTHTGFHKLGDGKRMRYAIVSPEKNVQGTVLVAPGRREFIEKKYTEVGKEFLERDFKLIFFDWRGQGLSDRFLDGARRQRDHIVDFDIHLSDLNSLYESIVKPNQTGPLLVCGHSMGSHLLLRWMAEQPSLPVTGAILTAPMLALSGSLAHAATSFISWSALKLGHGEDYAPMQHDYNEQDRSFTGNPLTHDAERFPIIERYFDAWPEMTVGGVSWEWLHAAIKSMHDLQRGDELDRVQVPILTLTGGKDQVTPPSEIGRYLKRLPNAENVTLDGALHDVMNEVPSCRKEAWQYIDKLLRKTINPYKFIGI